MRFKENLKFFDSLQPKDESCSEIVKCTNSEPVPNGDNGSSVASKTPKETLYQSLITRSQEFTIYKPNSRRIKHMPGLDKPPKIRTKLSLNSPNQPLITSFAKRAIIQSNNSQINTTPKTPIKGSNSLSSKSKPDWNPPGDPAN